MIHTVDNFKNVEFQQFHKQNVLGVSRQNFDKHYTVNSCYPFSQFYYRFSAGCAGGDGSCP